MLLLSVSENRSLVESLKNHVNPIYRNRETCAVKVGSWYLADSLSRKLEIAEVFTKYMEK